MDGYDDEHTPPYKHNPPLPHSPVFSDYGSPEYIPATQLAEPLPADQPLLADQPDQPLLDQPLPADQPLPDQPPPDDFDNFVFDELSPAQFNLILVEEHCSDVPELALWLSQDEADVEFQFI
jgi:hypothetical protein